MVTTSEWYRCAAHITERYMALVTKSNGGREHGIYPVNLAQRLWYETRDGSAMEAWEPEGVAIKETICLAQS